ncbi:aminoacyl-tRNA hydrolase, partial [Lactobacillus delbrueckii subsp. bulgaricus]|nr:aminoacyl-tRNA hydrolase [Lactobacillus delbrueckii subsp. bulgaricus]
MKLIVALGNPGLKYEKTKHNTGFMALDHYLDEKGLRLDRDKFTALYAKEKVAGEDVIFMEPQTYMNESGRAVGA